METHTHVIRPIENGEFEVYPGTQMPHTIHVFLAKVLKIPAHKFDVRVSFWKRVFVIYSNFILGFYKFN